MHGALASRLGLWHETLGLDLSSGSLGFLYGGEYDLASNCDNVRLLMEEIQVHFLYIQLALHLNVERTKSGFSVVLFELYIWLYLKLTQSCLSMIDDSSLTECCQW